jgi:hypothetical protein
VARTRGKHEAPDDPRPGEGLVRAGAVVFGVGVLGVLLAVVPFLFGREDAPSWTALTASLLPVGARAWPWSGCCSAPGPAPASTSPRARRSSSPERNSRAVTSPKPSARTTSSAASSARPARRVELDPRPALAEVAHPQVDDVAEVRPQRPLGPVDAREPAA